MKAAVLHEANLPLTIEEVEHAPLSLRGRQGTLVRRRIDFSAG